MKTITKIYIIGAVAAIFAAGMFGGTAWSDHQVRSLEKAVETAKQEAAAAVQTAAQTEQEAAAFREKADFLERQIAAMQTTARKQDEQLEKINIDTRGARARVARARSERPTEISTAELCQKLAGAGHPCER
jgi:septal ring factor EnvC (AmiA/AmiB activator)